MNIYQNKSTDRSITKSRNFKTDGKKMKASNYNPIYCHDLALNHILLASQA